MRKKSKLPPKWSDVYPQGTAEGDEEQRFFRSLVRSDEWTWRSTAHISKEARLEPMRVEEIANKYLKKGMVFQHPSNVDQWGYWELNLDSLPKKERSISGKDQKSRIDKVLGKSIVKTAPAISKKKAATAQALRNKAKKSGKSQRWVQKTLFNMMPHSH
tara:strand:- start:292 stop:768 length:477 start_codon:yes stop_codon:yes gene_type:complete